MKRKIELMFTIAALSVAVHFGAKIVVMEIDRASQWDALDVEAMIDAREENPELFHCWDCWIESGDPATSADVSRPELSSVTANQLSEVSRRLATSETIK